MSVHKRSNNGTYYVAYRDGNGRQHTKTFGKGRDGKREAEKFDKQVKGPGAVENGSPPPITATVAASGKIYLDQLAQMYINARKVEGTTLKTLGEIKSFLEKHFIPVFAQRPVEEIRYDEIMTIMGKAYAKHSPVTRGRYLCNRQKTPFLRLLNFLAWSVPRRDNHGSIRNRGAFREGDILD